MTFSKFFLILFLQAAVFIIIRLFFFNVTGFENWLYGFLYYALVFILSLAFARRLGVINYLEAIFVCIFWFFTNLFSDLLFTSNFLGTSMFTQRQLWLGYLAMLLAVFFFHKKRHVQIRKELHAKHHSHGHH